MKQDLVVTLGRRLVDVRFFHGHIDSAIDLAEDILYHLRLVYGSSHRWSIEIANLLSSMYMSKGDRSAAIAVLDIADLGVSSSVHHDDERGPVSTDSSRAAKSVKSKIEYLLRFYQQDDATESSVQESANLVDELSKQLNAPAHTVEKGDMMAHQPPSSWSFVDEAAHNSTGSLKR